MERYLQICQHFHVVLNTLRILHCLLNQGIVLFLFCATLNLLIHPYAVKSIEGGKFNALSNFGTSCSNRLLIVSIISLSLIQMQHPP